MAISIFSADWRNELLRWVADAGNLITGTIPDARISTTLTPDKAYRRGNILGTVTQSAGVPTGALIEDGTNANGTYVRFADGTQICRMTRNFGTGSWTAATNTTSDRKYRGPESLAYPASFVASPDVVISVQDGQVAGRSAWCTFYAPGTSSITQIYFAANFDGTLTNAIIATAVAKGRWF